MKPHRSHYVSLYLQYTEHRLPCTTGYEIPLNYLDKKGHNFINHFKILTYQLSIYLLCTQDMFYIVEGELLCTYNNQIK